MMFRLRAITSAGVLLTGGAVWWAWAQNPATVTPTALLQETRNLGKAFYETPGSSRQAVEQLKAALDLNPGSAREHLNYGLGLLRAGDREEGIAQLVAAQKLDRSLPHTYFNLGVEYKKSGEVEKALDQFLQMERLVPDEAKTQYNLGALYKQIGNTRRAVEKFERTIDLDPSLAAPHFQLFGMLRRTDPERANRELEIFKALKEATEDAAVGEDVDWSFYSELYDPSLANGSAAPAHPFAWMQRPLAEVSGAPRGALAWDLNSDGASDALVWSDEDAVVILGRSPAPGELTTGLGGSLHYGAGDFDGDGTADLCRVDGNTLEVVVNRSGKSFETVFSTAGDFEFCLFADYDHDNDFDLFALGADKRLYQNDGEGSLADVSDRFPFGPGRIRAAGTAELFEDNGHDFVVVYDDFVAVHQDRKLGVYGPAVPVEGARVSAGPARIDVLDADHDGYLDVAVTAPEGTVAVENRHGTLYAGPLLPRIEAWADFQLRGRLDAVSSDGFLANEGSFGFKSVAGSTALPAGRMVAGDFDKDGHPDLVVAGGDGKVLFVTGEVDSSYRGLTIRLEGVKSPAIGTGARVEVKAGLSYSKRNYYGVPLHFGLGAGESVETVRVTWANGLIQNEMPEDSVRELVIKEAPRLSGSCPMIFTWNGSEFEYIGEVLGVAPLGASLAQGVFFPVDHDEYVSIRGDQLRPVDGFLEVRLTEELRETAYVDKIRLVAVDHPGDTRIVSNEKAKGPPAPEFRLYGIRSKVLPESAGNHLSESVLEAVSAGDRRYATFRRDMQGRAETHSLTLRFPPFSDRDAVLFLEGWVDWASASSIVAASQTRASAIQPPYLEVLDNHGAWVKVISDMGLPGGTLRTIAVDLSGKFLSASRQVRIVSNMSVYWDAAYVGLGTSDPEVRLTELDAVSADLGFRGFSRNYVARDRMQPEHFDYQQVSATSNWNPTPGLYTRFGDVRELLGEEDDRFVIMGAGDEIQLRFSFGDLPVLPPGWARDYLLLVDGWAKENEANTAFGDSVMPLPFHSMSAYPYGDDEHYPQTPEHRLDLEHFHTRPAMRLVRPLVAGSSRR